MQMLCSHKSSQIVLIWEAIPIVLNSRTMLLQETNMRLQRSGFPPTYRISGTSSLAKMLDAVRLFSSLWYSTRPTAIQDAISPHYWPLNVTTTSSAWSSTTLKRGLHSQQWQMLRVPIPYICRVSWQPTSKSTSTADICRWRENMHQQLRNWKK